MIEYQDRLRNILHSDRRAFRQSLIRQSTIQQEQPEPNSGRSPWRYIIWPCVLISVPVTVLATVLLVIVFTNRVRPERDALDFDSGSDDYRHDILVNFSATRIVFLASFLSTVAPMLTSLIMSLYALLASKRLRSASQRADSSMLPTPYQMGLLVGLLLATIDQLRSYVTYFFSRQRGFGIPPVVNRSAVVLICTLALAWSVILTDSVLHYFTQTIDFNQVLVQPASKEYGRGLSSTCVDFNRTALFGWPCSVPIGWEDPNFVENQNEAVRLAHNNSENSEVRFSSMESGSGFDQLAYLVPAHSRINETMDYRATTVGVSTECRFIPPSECNFTTWGPDSIYTNFSCNGNFHGTIGKTPNSSEADGTRNPDPYRSNLMYKPAANLMYTFFSDPDLQTIYNSPGYNDSGQLDENTYPLEDSQLVNPFYITFAARTPTSSFQPTSPLVSSTNLTLATPASNQYVDYLLTCTVTSHDVTYTWLTSSGGDSQLTHTPSPNGTILEIFHGAQLYTGIGQGAYDLQDFLIQAAIATSSNSTTPTDFTQTFSRLYSAKVLAKIGAYTTPRRVEAQQLRQYLLVARIPTAALAALVALAFLYPLLAVLLGICAYLAVREEPGIGDVARQLSLRGLSATAFGEKSWGEDVDRGEGFVSRLRRGGTGMGMESRLGSGDVARGWEGSGVGLGWAQADKEGRAAAREHRRVRVSAAPGQGYVFKVWV